MDREKDSQQATAKAEEQKKEQARRLDSAIDKAHKAIQAANDIARQQTDDTARAFLIRAESELYNLSQVREAHALLSRAEHDQQAQLRELERNKKEPLKTQQLNKQAAKLLRDAQAKLETPARSNQLNKARHYITNSLTLIQHRADKPDPERPTKALQNVRHAYATLEAISTGPEPVDDHVREALSLCNRAVTTLEKSTRPGRDTAKEITPPQPKKRRFSAFRDMKEGRDRERDDR